LESFFVWDSTWEDITPFFVAGSASDKLTRFDPPMTIGGEGVDIEVAAALPLVALAWCTSFWADSLVVTTDALETLAIAADETT
jgi:hypothetical protein